MSSAADPVLTEVVRRICAVLDPLRIILFGSRARGDNRPDSDYDIMVVAESDKPRWERSGPLFSAVADLRDEFEFMVYTPHEVEDWSGVVMHITTTAMREGIVLYEKPA